MTLKEKFDIVSRYFEGPVERDVCENLTGFAAVLAEIEDAPSASSINLEPTTEIVNED